MTSNLKNNKHIRLIILLTLVPWLVLLLFWRWESIWTKWDYTVLDEIYKQAVKHGHGPKVSHRIVYIPITDETYEKLFGRNTVDRTKVALVNETLSRLNIRSLAYDIVFAYPSDSASDKRFESSLIQLGSVYLPIGFKRSEETKPFRWKNGAAYDRLHSYLAKPVEHGQSHPFHATDALMQADEFARATFSSGHISSVPDDDGVSRHIIMLMKIDDKYFPTLSLSMFLNYADIPFENIIVNWGKEIVIPAIKGSRLEHDVIIPIDDKGRAVIPYAEVWKEDFENTYMEMSSLLEKAGDNDLQGNLLDFFEDKFVFIADTSSGISDLGQTPLESGVPLVVVHTAMLNGMVTNTFYRELPSIHGKFLITILYLLLGVSALSKRSWILYSAGVVMLVGISGLTWFQFIHFTLMPVFTIFGSCATVFFTLITGIKVASNKEKDRIRNTFSRYVPQKVVDHLLENPALLALGGEERVVTVLFTDLAGFTTISENMTPSQLVELLNEYLTEMTEIVLEEGGIIDKYEGDAIMAEFGVPIQVANSADRAVRTGLRMQRRLVALRQDWLRRELPELRCRIGINTGPMIVGNMGSNQFSNYTVIGDAVNLASRLESANKRYCTHLMISEFTCESLTPGMFKLRHLDVIKVKGKNKAVKVYEVYGDMSDKLDENNELYYQNYDEAFACYLLRDFPRAGELFSKASALRPDDPAAREMVARIAAINAADLPLDWDGSIDLGTLAEGSNSLSTGQENQVDAEPD